MQIDQPLTQPPHVLVYEKVIVSGAPRGEVFAPVAEYVANAVRGELTLAGNLELEVGRLRCR